MLWGRKSAASATPDPMFEVVTFNCYGTLIDWEEGIWSAFRDRADLEVSRKSELLEAYRRSEAVIEADEYRSYRHVLRQAAVDAGAKLSIDVGDGSFLPESMASWLPFPDTNSALEKLQKRGVALAILSNVDDDLLAMSRQLLTVNFEFVITAQQVRSYKPARAHFDAARFRTSGRRWLHAAQSYFHDIVPAVDRGIACAWINRKQQSPAGSQRASYEFTNLGPLADFSDV